MAAALCGACLPGSTRRAALLRKHYEDDDCTLPLSPDAAGIGPSSAAAAQAHAHGAVDDVELALVAHTPGSSSGGGGAEAEEPVQLTIVSSPAAGQQTLVVLTRSQHGSLRLSNPSSARRTLIPLEHVLSASLEPLHSHNGSISISSSNSAPYRDETAGDGLARSPSLSAAGTTAPSPSVRVSISCLVYASPPSSGSGFRRSSPNDASAPLGPLKLWTLEGKTDDVRAARSFVDALVSGAYAQHPAGSALDSQLAREHDSRGGSKKRRALVLVNPHGGPGKAKTLWERDAAPVFRAANFELDVIYTGPEGAATHATAVAKHTDLSKLDMIVCVSGDGVVHEVLAGLSSRKPSPTGPGEQGQAQSDPLKTPIGVIPAGSGNALSVCISGPEHAEDAVYAALVCVKGRPIPLDVCSVTQGNIRRLSFLSTAYGLMADLDLGTEHLRWMGDARFVVGFIQGALAKRKYGVELAMRVVDGDKHSIARTYADERHRASAAASTSESGADGLPPLKYGTATDTLAPVLSRESHFPTSIATPSDEQQQQQGWHVVEAPLLFFYAGTLPYVAKEHMFFPAAAISDGLIDLVVCPPMSRISALQALDGTDKGSTFANKQARYYKCTAFRLSPRKLPGTQTCENLAIDGERFPPFEPVQVEVHPRLARVISLKPNWAGLDSLPLPKA